MSAAPEVMKDIRPILWVVPLLIVSGLPIDQFGGRWGQSIVVFATAMVFFWFYHEGDAVARATMRYCLLYATAGEVLLSLVLRVYEYRLDNLPLFVPPGHVLLFMLGVAVAPRLGAIVVNGIGIVAALGVAWLAFTGRDTLSVVLVTVFLLTLIFGRDRKLYATMFVLALAMELYGTWLGNWEWHTMVGTTGLVSTNPPVAAGAFYGALDLLVMVTMRLTGNAKGN